MYILFKNHCQLNLKTTKMALVETGAALNFNIMLVIVWCLIDS